MNLIEELMNQRWIIKKENPKLYYQIKDNAKEIQNKVQDKFGYSLIINPHVIKLEKIPGKPEVWMGIDTFKSIQEYQMFCYVLMYLEDKDDEEQFVLSSLNEYIQAQFPEGEIDWTSYRIRKNLVTVIKYCIKAKIIIQDDGDEEGFIKDITNEVLYENTGISRYYMRNFSRDIMEFDNPSDFLQSEFFDVDEDRGIVRRQRVYRRLLLSCGVYRGRDKTSLEDFNYIRNYRRNIENDFESMFQCDLHLHTSSAYLSLPDDSRMGKVFPHYNNCICDLLLISHDAIRKRVKNGQYSLEEHELVILNLDTYRNLLKKITKVNFENLPKKYRDEGLDKTAERIYHMALSYGFIDIKEDIVTVYPIAGKIIGQYQVREGI